MLMASMPVAVIMQRHPPVHRWTDASWSAAGVIPWPDTSASARLLDDAAADAGAEQTWLYPGLQLELHRDEDDGYFENWAAPEPKIFVMWRMKEERAVPVLASVSYGEGTRMLDSGDPVDGVAMPPDVHAWLTAYLRAWYQPKPRRGRQHG